jgi:hypothetical protein
MKQFKIKNRKKRKYVKKNSVYALPTTKALTFGSIPLISILLGIITSFIVVSFPYTNLDQPIHIDFSVIKNGETLITTAITTFIIIWQTILQWIQLSLHEVTKLLITILPLLNPQPIIRTCITFLSMWFTTNLQLAVQSTTMIINELLLLTKITISIIFTLYTFAITTLQQSFKINITLFAFCYQVLLSCIQYITSVIITIATILLQSALTFTAFLINLFQFCIQQITAFFQMMIRQIIQISNEISNMITFPFKKMGEYLTATTPYLQYFGSLTQKAAEQLTGGVENLSKLSLLLKN